MRPVTFLALAVAAGTASGQFRGEPSPPIHLPPVVSPSLRLLTQPAVQAELSLTDRQKQAVVDLNGAWDISPRTWETGSLGWLTPEIGRAAVMLRTKQFLETGLTKDQRARLDQVVFQLREREFGAYAAFAMAARDLNLRPEQVKDLPNSKGREVKEIAKHLRWGKGSEKVKNRVPAPKGETLKKLTERLPRPQREFLRECAEHRSRARSISARRRGALPPGS